MEARLRPASEQSSAARSPIDRARALAPVIAGASDQIERERRLPPALLDALHEARMFRLLLPKKFGGDELHLRDFALTILEVAQHDASTAWCLCQAAGCAMTAAYLEPEVAEEIWGHDPRAVLAWGPGKAQIVREGDHWRVTGSWSFASGGRHATWLGGHSVVTDADGKPQLGPDGKPLQRTALFPASTVEMRDVWNVIGLRGTASDAYEVDGLVVRHDYTVTRDDPADRRYDAPLYTFTSSCAYASGFACTALGIARGMLDAFKDLACEKTPRRAKYMLRDDPVIQYEVAICEARLGAACAYLVSELDEIWDEVAAGSELTPTHRMRIRRYSTFAIHEAKAVADTIYDAAGATAIFETSPFVRRFRDIHTVTQQIQGRKLHFTGVGAFLLGHPWDMSVL